MSLNDNSDAQANYNKAFKLYMDSKAPRGQAQIRFQQARIKHAVVLKKARKSLTRGRVIEDARCNLEEAESLFGMDINHQLLAVAHRIMLNISAGTIDGVVHQVYELGATAARNYDIITAQYAGVLIMKFGQRVSNDDADSHVTFLCLRCVHACFLAIRDSYLAFTALTTRLELSTTLSDHSKSRAPADKIVSSFRSLHNLFVQYHKRSLE